MNELIPVSMRQIGVDTLLSADARDLHEFLAVETDFKDWMPRRIDEYNFEEGKDFRSFLGESTGGRPPREYIISLDMAKELAMVERNAKGKAARQYFIECERVATSSRKPMQVTPLREQVDAGILLLRAAAEDLKFAPSAVLGGYQKLEHHVGVAGLLPAYAVDAPLSAVTGSSEETKAVGDLLEQFGVGVSAIAFNRLLIKHGFIAERERPSSKGAKKFKVCVNLDFGKNLSSPSNPRETQPHWYVGKFAELLDLVLPAKPTAAA